MKLSDIERKFEAGERILTPGGFCRELFVIRKGAVRIEKNRPERLGPGELFGELGAILGCPVPFGAVAESEVTALALDVALLTEFCAAPGEFSLRVIRHLAQQLEATISDPARPAAEVTGPPRQELRRVGAAILERARPAADAAGRVSAVGDLQDLATAAELPLEDAYRLVQRLFEARYLRLDGGRLSLLDLEGLRSLGAEDPAEA